MTNQPDKATTEALAEKLREQERQEFWDRQHRIIEEKRRRNAARSRG